MTIKRFLAVFVVLFFASTAFAANNVYHAGSLTGGASGALDAIDGADLAAGDIAYVTTSTADYKYVLDSSGDAESSPTVISPDDNAGTKRWKLVGLYATTLQLGSGTSINEISTDGTMAGNSDNATPTEKAVVTYVGSQAGIESKHPGFMILPKFAYNGGSTAYTITLGPARGYCKDKYFYYTSALTSPAISGAVADTWYYLYLDYSAMTDGNELTNSELVWSTTGPTFNGTYDQQMNSDDRFLVAVLANSTPDNILDFTHSGGDLLRYIPVQEDRAYATITAGWNSYSLTLPDFGSDTEGAVLLWTYDNSGSTSYYYRPTGNTNTTGAFVAGATGAYNTPTVKLLTDSSQQVDINASAASYLGIYTVGYYFPRGMGK